MQRKRALVKLNDLNHLRGQSTEILFGVFQTQGTIRYRQTFDIWFRSKLFTVKYDNSKPGKCSYKSHFDHRLDLK